MASFRLLIAVFGAALVASLAPAVAVGEIREAELPDRIRVCADSLTVTERPNEVELARLEAGQSMGVRKLSASGKYAYGFAYGDANRVGWVRTAGLCGAGASVAERSIAASPEGVRWPVLTVAPDGRTVLAWERLRHSDGRLEGVAVEARAISPSGRLGRVQRLTETGLQPTAAVGEEGTRAVAWQELGEGSVRRVRVAVASSGTTFDRPQTLTSVRTTVSPSGLAVSPEGRVVAVWQQGGELRYAVREPGERRFGEGRRLAEVGLGTRTTVAKDPRSGEVLVAWGTRPVPGGRNRQAAVAALAPGATTFGAAQVVSGRDAEEQPGAEAYPRVFAGPGGAAVGYGLGGQLPNLLRSASRLADGSFAPSRTMAGVDVSSGRVGYWGPVLALPTDGATVATWTVTRHKGAEDPRPAGADAFVAIAPPGAPFDEPRRLTDGRATRLGPPAAVAARRHTHVAWAEHTDDGGRVRYAVRPDGGTLGAARTLSGRRADGDIVLAAAGQRVLATWQERDQLRLSRLGG